MKASIEIEEAKGVGIKEAVLFRGSGCDEGKTLKENNLKKCFMVKIKHQ